MLELLPQNWVWEIGWGCFLWILFGEGRFRGVVLVLLQDRRWVRASRQRICLLILRGRVGRGI